MSLVVGCTPPTGGAAPVRERATLRSAWRGSLMEIKHLLSDRAANMCRVDSEPSAERVGHVYRHGVAAPTNTP
eukprot:6951315-Prymnesium_polylepis.2